MRYSIAALLFCIFSGGALAQVEVPHTFESGERARASEVNENFEFLAERIAALESLVAPTADSLAGTYDYFEVSVDVDDLPQESYGIAGASVFGTVTFNADGTGSGDLTENYRQITTFETNKTVDATSGATQVKETDITLNVTSEPNDFDFTWTLSGNTISVGDESFVVSGGIMVGRVSNEGQGGLAILVRRPD